MQIRSANCLNKILKSIKITKLVESVCAVAYPFEVLAFSFCLQLAKLKYKKEDFKLKETWMLCAKVMQFKKHSLSPE